MIRFAEIEIGSGECSTCSRCSASADRVPRGMPAIESDLARVAAAWEFGPGPNVIFCGFEPFDHPQLPAVIARAAQSGFERIGLRTSGGALTVPANAKGVIVAGVRFVELVLLGDEASHDSLAGLSGAFADAVAGCRAFVTSAAEAGADVAVFCRVPACRHNVTALSGAVAGGASAGALAVHIDAESLPATAAEAVIAACEVAAMSRMAAYVTGADFAVPAPFGESPVCMDSLERLAAHEPDGDA